MFDAPEFRQRRDEKPGSEGPKQPVINKPRVAAQAGQ
jgi:hypothetical protein